MQARTNPSGFRIYSVDELVTRLAELEHRQLMNSTRRRSGKRSAVLPSYPQSRAISPATTNGSSENRENRFPLSGCHTTGTLQKEIAKNVTAIVGLKEAMTWKRDVLRWVWIVSLVIGISSTVFFVFAALNEYYDKPTATRVEMKPEKAYDYPLILLCPDQWLDTEKALSLGLTVDSLKYSLGYFFDGDDDLRLENVTTAKRDFLDFYDRYGFRSLDDYFKTIALDISITKGVEGFVTATNASAFCEVCIEQPRKVIYENAICYGFKLKAEDGSRRSLGRQIIGVKLPDRTNGLIRISKRWQLFVSNGQNSLLKSSQEASVGVKAQAWSIIHIQVRRIINLQDGEYPCANAYPTTSSSDASSELCYARCMGDWSEEFQCHMYERSIADSSSDHQHSPDEFCNFFETRLADLWHRFAYANFQTAKTINGAEVERCSRECPYECDRTVYQLSLRDHMKDDDLTIPQQMIGNKSREQNMTAVGIRIEHGAAYDGGVQTLTEIPTISRTSLVSNLGGALGLFVGGTMMTFIQIILFPVKFCLDRRDRRHQQQQATAVESNAPAKFDHFQNHLREKS